MFAATDGSQPSRLLHLHFMGNRVRHCPPSSKIGAGSNIVAAKKVSISHLILFSLTLDPTKFGPERLSQMESYFYLFLVNKVGFMNVKNHKKKKMFETFFGRVLLTTQ